MCNYAKRNERFSAWLLGFFSKIFFFFFPEETLNNAFLIYNPLCGDICLIFHVPLLKYSVVCIFNLRLNISASEEIGKYC